MINKTTHLKGNEELALQIALEVNSKQLGTEYYHKKENIIQAINELAKAKLKYNPKNGTTYLYNKWNSCYSDGEPPTYNSIDELIKWEFVYDILHAAGRIERGFKAV